MLKNCLLAVGWAYQIYCMSWKTIKTFQLH